MTAICGAKRQELLMDERTGKMTVMFAVSRDCGRWRNGSLLRQNDGRPNGQEREMG